MGFTAKEGTADGYIKFDNSNGAGQCFISINGRYFSYNGSAIIISLNKINLERHYINYILDLLLYLDNQKK